MSGGGQYTDDSLLNSEQASVIVKTKLVVSAQVP